MVLLRVAEDTILLDEVEWSFSPITPYNHLPALKWDGKQGVDEPAKP